jgi:GT2 family glycosyltransferase
MLLTILLPVHNGLDYTTRNLNDLYRHTDKANTCDIKIIVIDDGSTDGTHDWIKTHFPEIIVLIGNGNLWWSGAINVGAHYAFDILNADYILLWNNDVFADENYFSELNSILNPYNGNNLIGSKVMVYEDPEKIWSMGGFFNPKNGKYDMYGYYEKDSILFSEIYEVDWLTGMGTIIPKSVVEKIGYWDNVNFPQYHGDSDFTYRAKINGFKLLVYPSLKIFNSVKNTGIEHEGNLKSLFHLLTNIKSKCNIAKNFKFYRLYATSFRAYIPLVWIYMQIIGGFFKWKLLNILGVRKNRLSSS